MGKSGEDTDKKEEESNKLQEEMDVDLDDNAPKSPRTRGRAEYGNVSDALTYGNVDVPSANPINPDPLASNRDTFGTYGRAPAEDGWTRGERPQSEQPQSDQSKPFIGAHRTPVTAKEVDDSKKSSQAVDATRNENISDHAKTKEKDKQPENKSNFSKKP